MTADAGPVLYGFSLGLVAAVNPCGFPLLPAYLMAAAPRDLVTGLAGRGLRAITAGVAMTAGFVIVFGILGAAVKLGLGTIAGWVPWIMVPVGIACVVAGCATALGRPLPVHLAVPRARAGWGRTGALVGFGVAYAVASLTCALPLFLVGVADSFTQRGAVIGLTSGVAYALGMGLVVTAVSLAGVGAGRLRLGRIRQAQPVLARGAGAVLALVGAYLVIYWIADLVDPLSTPAPVRAVEWVQGHAAQLLSASPRLSGVVIGVIVIGVLVAAGVRAGMDPAAGSRAAAGDVDVRSPA